MMIQEPDMDTVIQNFARLIMHGGWIKGNFFIWAESAEPSLPSRGRPKLARHPHSVSPDALCKILARWYPDVMWDTMPEAAFGVFLPSLAGLPLLPPWLRDQPFTSSLHEADVSEDSPVLLPWRVKGLQLDVLTALDLLVALPVRSADRRWGNDLLYWSAAAKLGLEFLSRQAYLPALQQDGGTYRAFWLPVFDGPDDRSRLRNLAEAMPLVCRAYFTPTCEPDPAQAQAPNVILDDFFRKFMDCAVREWGRLYLDKRRRLPDGVASTWWQALWSVDGRITIPVRERRALVAFYDAWSMWLGQLSSVSEAAFRLCFRLDAPEVDLETGKVQKPDWTLHYLLQANDDPSLLVSLKTVWNASGGTLQYLTYRFENAQEQALMGLGVAARLFPPIKQSLCEACPDSCVLSADEAYAFLCEVGPLLEGSGFGVLIPPWWNKPGARLGVRASMRSDSKRVSKGVLTMNSLVSFDWELSLGDAHLTHEEFDRLVALKMPLVKIRGQWVLLQPEEIEAAIAFWKKQQEQVLSLGEVMKIAWGVTEDVNGLPVHDIELSGWTADLLERLQSVEKVDMLPVPEGFVGQLRPYQARGLSWLTFMREWGLGACLADDMGLGKTIQAIVLLLHERENAENAMPPALLICPTSVVGNWKREVARFAPSLRVLVHHGANRERGEAFVEAAQQHDLVISTYGMARRDVDDLVKISWSDIILDEAQNIKNPSAKQTRAIRKLKGDNHVALTGTPVENRLSELWSIMQFLNPGFLGTQKRFRETFALPIERYHNETAATRLRGMTGPFILRRLKTDATIIQDLPEKLEMKVYCSLTSEQATLYQAVVAESLLKVEQAEDGETASDFSRRGAILGSLLRLKQVCNHPAHYLGDGSALSRRSGKLERLTEMLEEVLSVGDRALIFTQFAEMGRLLQGYLQSLFGVEALYLHGGTSPKQRDRMVARFQGKGGPPIFILSLKAGGTGLNLTAANHVFHFDRWWNPAVEDQATDRAFRIGQTRDVQVHKLICAGTLEEKIDALIESKKALVQNVIGAGENWLTELSTDELRRLIALSGE